MKLFQARRISLKQKISQKELSIFTKQLSTLLSAGTPLETSLMLLSQQANQNLLMSC